MNTTSFVTMTQCTFFQSLHEFHLHKELSDYSMPKHQGLQQYPQPIQVEKNCTIDWLCCEQRISKHSCAHCWHVQVKKVREYVKDPKFTVDDIRSISTAGAGLLKWVFAMVNYYRQGPICLLLHLYC